MKETLQNLKIQMRSFIPGNSNDTDGQTLYTKYVQAPALKSFKLGHLKEQKNPALLHIEAV